MFFLRENASPTCLVSAAALAGGLVEKGVRNQNNIYSIAHGGIRRVMLLPDKQEIIIILSKRKKPERAARKPAGRIPWRLSGNSRGGYPGSCPQTCGEGSPGKRIRGKS